MSGVLKSSFPSAAEEELVDVIHWDEYLTPHKEASYILKVKSNAMAKAGILEGDMIIVERRQTYKPGQIVVLQGESGFRLAYLPTHSDTPLKVEAVVTAVVRKY